MDWEHYDLSAMTRRDSSVGAGTFSLSNERMVETDMAQTNVGFRYTTTAQKPDLNSPMDKVSPFALSDVGGCELDGIATDCSLAMQLRNSGAAQQCPNNDCSVQMTRHGWATFQAFKCGQAAEVQPGRFKQSLQPHLHL